MVQSDRTPDQGAYAPPDEDHTAPAPSPRPQTVEDLIPDDENHNKGTERGTGLLEGVLRRVGAGRSIVIDRNNRIIAGNQVVAAAVNAGLIKLRVVETTGQELVAVRRTDLSLDSKEGRELSLADNFSHEVSFDPDVLVVKRHVEQYAIDLNDIGLSEDELAAMLKKAKLADPEGEDGGDQSGALSDQYLVVITCRDEMHQTELLDRFDKEGLKCEARVA